MLLFGDKVIFSHHLVSRKINVQGYGTRYDNKLQCSCSQYTALLQSKVFSFIEMSEFNDLKIFVLFTSNRSVFFVQ